MSDTAEGTVDETTAEQSRRRVGPRTRRALVASVPTLLFVLHAGRYRQWIVDDAGLTFASARSFARGAGAVVQPGAAPVEAFSNPTWTGVLVVGRWLRLFDTRSWFGLPDLVLFPKAVAVLCCFGIVWCFHSIATAVLPRAATSVTIAAGAITAAVPSFVIWTTSGLENPLFALIVTAVAATLVGAATSGRIDARSTAVTCGVLAATAALTRPDGVVYLAAYPVAVAVLLGARSRLRPVLLSLATAAVPLAVYLAWRWSMFGTWLPNPALAKAQGLPVPADLDKPTDLLAYAGWLGSILLIAFVVAVFVRPSRVRPAVAMLLVPLVLAVFAYTVLARDWMTQLRFSTPVWPLAAMALALCVAEFVPRLDPPRRLAVIGVLVLAVLTTETLWRQRSDQFVAVPTVSMCAVARTTGYTFNSYADRLGIDDGSLLAVDGGGTALTSRLRFVDLSGLADTHIARYWSDRDMAGLRDHVFDGVRPTFIRIWHGWDGEGSLRLLDDPRLERDYVRVWGPAEGGGNYVRRDAVEDLADVAALQEAAPKLAADVEAPWRRNNVGWWCGDMVTPSSVGDDPLTTMPT